MRVLNADMLFPVLNDLSEIYRDDEVTLAQQFVWMELLWERTDTIPPLDKGKLQGRCHMYQFRNQQEAIEILRDAGFTQFQMDKLVKFRRRFILGEKDTASIDQRRLEFARWLFLSGKLNDMGR